MGGAVVALLGVGVLGFLASRSTVPGQTTVDEPGPGPTREDVEATEASLSGPSLEWVPADDAVLDVNRVISVVHFRGRYLAFGGEPGPVGNPRGLRAYASSDGSAWTDLGVVIAGPVVVSSVASSGDRLVALGGVVKGDMRAYRFGFPPTSPAVWVSSDGTSWQRHDLPIPAESEEVARSALVHAGAIRGAQAIVVARRLGNLEQILLEAVPAPYRALLDEPGFSVGMEGPPYSFQIRGPFGIVVFSATVEELGIDPQVMAEFVTGLPPAPYVWTTSKLGTWEAADADPFGARSWVNQILVGPDEVFFATGYAAPGAALWRSEDGANWELRSLRLTPSPVATFSDRLISTQAGYGRASIAASVDGKDWTEITPEGLFTSPGGIWYFASLSAGGYGIAALATFEREDEMQQGRRNPPLVIQKDGVTITYDEMSGTVTVVSDGESILEFDTEYSETLPDQVVIDLEAGTIQFADPGSEEVRVTLGFDEIFEAETERYRAFSPPGEQHSAIVFSPDGSEWSIQDVDEIFGNDLGEVTQLFVLDDFVLAAVQQIDRTYFLDPTEYGPPPTELWLGTRP
jgi:hypothetical protein